MAKFFAGQRVRMVAPVFHPEFQSKEGTLVGTSDHPLLGNGYWIDLDGVARPEISEHWFTTEDQIEPVQDSKQRQRVNEETVPWEECMFSREGKYIEREVTCQ